MNQEIENVKLPMLGDNVQRSSRASSYVPFYDDGQIRIYNGNFESVLPQLAEKIDVIITDPPYPDVLVEEFGYYEGILKFLEAFNCRQLVFWSAKESFPLSYTARHIWAKANRNVGENGELYEPVFERNGKTTSLVWRHAVIDSEMNAQLNGDRFFDHPTQKPIRLMNRIVKYSTQKNELILDTFAGVGTTLLAAKNLGRRAIGIERNLEWCEVAAKRLDQFELFR